MKLQQRVRKKMQTHSMHTLNCIDLIDRIKNVQAQLLNLLNYNTIDVTQSDTSPIVAFYIRQLRIETEGLLTECTTIQQLTQEPSN